MAATEFELLGEWEAELEGGYPEFEWEGSLHPRFEGELPLGRRAVITPQLRRQIEKHKLAHDRLMRAVGAMRKHVAIRNGRLHFTLPARSTHEAAAKLGIAHRLFLQLHNYMKRRNTRHTSRPSFNAEAAFESGRRCDGVTKIEGYWWGHEIWLNDCDTGAMLTVMGGAVAGATACAKIPPLTLVCSVLAGLGIAYTVIIDAVNKHGGNRGVIITWARNRLPSYWHHYHSAICDSSRTYGPLV